MRPCFGRIMRFLVQASAALVLFPLANGFSMNLARSPGKVQRGTTSRHEIIEQFVKIASGTFAGGVIVARPAKSSAAQKINKPLGQESFRRIRDARQLLDRVDVPLRARNFDEVQELLEDPASSKLDKALTDLVQSNVLPSDDKVSVGTIRTYGLAADALITLGGLSAATRDGDGGEARKMLVLTKEALNDILTIGVNNDLNRT